MILNITTVYSVKSRFVAHVKISTPLRITSRLFKFVPDEAKTIQERHRDATVRVALDLLPLH